MASELETLINGVLLPATAGSAIEPPMERFLSSGGRAILFGESREEYLAREMSAERRARESSDSLAAELQRAREIAGAVLVAVDQEIVGIQRLAHLLPPLPGAAELPALDDEQLREAFAASAIAAKRLGVNVFLAPIVDTLTGPNPWLDGRTVSSQIAEVSRVSGAFVRAAQDAGVLAVVKHFPGHAHVPLDPAVQPRAIVEGSLASLSAGFAPFEACIAEGAGGMMLGPAPVPAIDASCAASCSPVVVDFLKAHFGFGGLIVSDGLEAAATAAGRPVAEVACRALNAGVELLLVGCDERLPALAQDLAAAVERGELDEAKLRRAAERVAQLARHYDDGE